MPYTERAEEGRFREVPVRPKPGQIWMPLENGYRCLGVEVNPKTHRDRRREVEDALVQMNRAHTTAVVKAAGSPTSCNGERVPENPIRSNCKGGFNLIPFEVTNQTRPEDRRRAKAALMQAFKELKNTPVES